VRDRSNVLKVYTASHPLPFLLAAMFVVVFLPEVSSAQPVALELEDVDLRQALEMLEAQSSLRFVYDDAAVDGILVSLRCADCQPLAALQLLLRDLPLRYVDSGDGLIVLLRAQLKFRVTGVVVDAETGETLPLAHVYLDQAGVAADANGAFVFENRPAGSHVAVASYLGFRQLSERVQLTADTTLVFRLHRLAFDVGTVVVRAAPAVPILDRPGQATIIGFRGIATVPGVGAGDPLNALSQLPGVDNSEETAAGLFIRGSTPDDNLLQWEGIPLFNAEHLFGMISTFSPEVVGGIRMYMRGSPARLGGRTGGFVLLDGATTRGGVRLTATVSPLFGGAVGRFPIGSQAGLLVSVRRSMPTLKQSGAYRTYFDSVLGRNSVGTTTPGFSFQDLNVRFVALARQRHVLALNLHSGADNLAQTFDDELESLSPGSLSSEEQKESVTSRWSNTGVSAVWTGSWSDRSQTNGVVSFSRYSNRYRFEREVQESQSETRFRASHAVREARLSLRQRMDVNDWLEFSSGAFVKRYEVTFSGEDSSLVGSATELFDESSASILGSFSEGNLDLLGGRVSATGGLRSTWYDLTSRFYLEPRIQFVVRVTPFLSLESSFGRHHQFLSRVLGSDVLEESRDRWDLADKTDGPARSTQRSIRLQAARRHLTTSIEVYRNSLAGVDELSRRRDLTSLERTTGDGTASGFESQIRYARTHLSAWATYSLSRIRYKFDSLNNNRSFAPLHERPHSVKLAVEFARGPWALGLRFTWASGRRAVIPDGQRSIDSQGTVIDSPLPQGARLPDYHRMDLQIRRTLHGRGVGAEFELALVNLYNRRNVRHRRYAVDAGQIRFRDTGMLGFTPVLTVRVGNSRL
jgi:ferric enterobactin receptor